MIFIFSYIITIILNWYIIINGKKDLEQLKNKISVKKYLNEINETIVSQIGNRNATILKIIFMILCISIVIVNAFDFLACIAGVVLGTYVAKKSYQVSYINNFLNKLATYVNRLR